jgi:exocyst complex protein 7
LASALQNRDLLKHIGESEEYQPLETRPIREIRSVFDCLGSHGYHLGPSARREPPGLAFIFGMAPNKVMRTEKVGSGCFSNLVLQPLKTGFPQLDAYGEARKSMAFSSVDTYYRRIKQDRKKRLEKNNTPDSPMEDRIDEADEAARDAVRCLEHAMVVVAGEKSVYRTIVTPSLTETVDDYYEEEEEQMSPYFKKSCGKSLNQQPNRRTHNLHSTHVFSPP